jgi:hypothetical protein
VPKLARPTKQDSVRELQRTLYRAAKPDPERRFHALYDKVHRRDVLDRAWELVRANHGAAGIDRQTIADVERELYRGLGATSQGEAVARAEALGLLDPTESPG